MSGNLDADLRRTVQAIDDAMALIDALHRRVLELEAEVALLRGAMAEPSPETPTQITHDVPPSAPR